MAAPSTGTPDANTLITTGTNATTGQRESLDDLIARIDPDETPFYSNSRKGKASAINEEWLVQELEPADENAQLEGYQASPAELENPARFGNYCQIVARIFDVSGTSNAVNKAGRQSDYDYHSLLKGLEVRRDLEWSLVRGTPKSGTAPRKLAGILAWITNGSVGAGAGLMPTGDGTDGPTPGTARPLSLALIADAMQAAYTDGGKPSMLMLHPTQKRIFSGLSGSAGQVAANEFTMTRAEPATIIGSVSVFLTDFGRLECVVNRIMRNTDAILVDPRYAECVALPGRSFKREKLAKTGDAERGHVLWEGTLKVRAPKAHAAVLDLTTA